MKKSLIINVIKILFMKRFKLLKVLGIIIMALAGLSLFSAIVMLLWNSLIPGIFHLSVITFWQALGLLVLSKLLFGGFRGGWAGRHHWRKNDMRQKWMNMTPEERTKFKQEWRNRCWSKPEEEKQVP